MLAGERGYIPLSTNIVPATTLKGHWDAVEAGAVNTGRTADRSTWRIARDVYVADTTEEAREEALHGVLARDFRDYFLKLLLRNKMIDLMKTDTEMPDSDVTVDYLVDNIWVVGSPEEVAGKLRSLYREVGGFGVLLTMGHEWEPRDKWVCSMTLLAEEVIPRLSDLG